MDACLRFGVLGPLEITRDGEPVTLGSYKQRCVLAALLVDRNHVVSSDRLIDDLWADDDGHDHQNALWAHISNLRKALEPDLDDRTSGVLMTSSPGYVLRVEDESVDAAVFERRVAEGRALLDTDPAAVAGLLSEALAMWRGRPLEDFTYETWALAEIARLEELRLEAVELRITAELKTGRRRELIGELESLVHLHPTRESLTASLMLALHGAGRQAEALRRYRSLQGRLGEELGIRPSARLQRLHDQIAAGDPALDCTEEVSGDAASGPAVRGYEVRERIGERGSGIVYRAYQPALGREVALTIVRPELANDPGFIRRFEAEAQTVARLEHPNIVPVYDYWREHGQAYVVARLVGGRTLRDVIDSGEVLAPDTLVRLVDQIGAALETAHLSGVHHGNVTAEHVLVDDRGDTYLADFEIAAPSARDGAADDVRGFAAVIAQAATTDLDPALARAIEAASAMTESAPDIASFRRELSEILHRSDRPVATVVTQNPYRGLRSFEQSDAVNFFGRDRFVQRVLARLGRSGSAGSFVAVVGPSGSGKSSVVKAGLLPALRSGAVDGSDEWFVVEMTPGVHPFEQLEEAFIAVAVDPPSSLLEVLTGAHGIQRAASDHGDAQVLLLVDQFEELFTLTSPDVAARFMEALTDAVENAPDRIKVVITLRADYFDRPLGHHGIGRLLRTGTELLTPMTPGELECAITGPAQRAGARCEPDLVSELIAAMAPQPSALPLLEYTLTELFEQRGDGDVLRSSTYRELGGLSGALVDRAEAIFNELGADGRLATEQVFLRLVALDGRNAIRRRVLLSELRSMSGIGQHVTSIVETFARHRLLTLDRDPASRATTVEISHETLFTTWPRLARWIDAARADVIAERRLAQLAAEWVERDRSSDFVLGAGRFARYASWAEHAPVAITPDERDFLEASITAAEERERTRRRQRERDSRLRRRSALLVGLAAITAFVIGLAAFAIVQQRRASDLADQIAAAAEARRLGAEAQVLADSEPGLAMVAALESARTTAPSGEILPASMDALYAVLGTARIQYPFADAQAVVRPAAGGGVFLMPPDELIALVQQNVPSGVPDARCRDLGLADCGVATEPFPDDLQIAGGATAYTGVAVRPAAGRDDREPRHAADRGRTDGHPGELRHVHGSDRDHGLGACQSWRRAPRRSDSWRHDRRSARRPAAGGARRRRPGGSDGPHRVPGPRRTPIGMGPVSHESGLDRRRRWVALRQRAASTASGTNST